MGNPIEGGGDLIGIALGLALLVFAVVLLLHPGAHTRFTADHVLTPEGQYVVTEYGGDHRLTRAEMAKAIPGSQPVVEIEWIGTPNGPTALVTVRGGHD